MDTGAAVTRPSVSRAVSTAPLSAARSTGSLLQRTCACGSAIKATTCPKCGRDEHESIRQKSALDRAAGDVPSAVHQVLHSPIEPLDKATPARMEERFGHDFSRILVNASGPAKIQAKLTINTPGDVYEQEADRIADQVMATPADTAISGAPQRIQRVSGRPNGQQVAAAPPSVDQALASPGRPLEPALRQDMEQRFGHDFSQVRVHSGTVAEQSARDVDSRAYTAGQHIVFGANQFAPGKREGWRLLAHELTHVVQQSQRAGMGFVQRQGMGDLRYAEACNDIIDKIRDTYKFRNLSIPKRSAIEASITDIRKQTAPDQYRPWPDQYRLLNKVLEEVREETHDIGAKQLPVKAYYFPGQTNRVAMIVSGVHGSEVSGVEVVQHLLKSMGAARPFFSVILIPELFPDQVAREMAQKRSPGSNSNTFRESGEKIKPTDKEEIPTNRNYPTPTGTTPVEVRKNAAAATQDELGVPILKQNQVLLELINRFKPERIASVHANRRAAGMKRGGPGSGVFVDPAQQGNAPTDDRRVEDADADRDHPKTEEDRLAANMARRIVHGGGRAGGNFVDTTTGKDWRERPVGQTRYDPKNTLHNKGQSLGTWGPKAGMTVITVEVPWYEHSSAYKEGTAREDRLKEMQAYSASLEEIFLGP